MGPYLIKKIELEGLLSKIGKVLDLGSGQGTDALYFAKQGYEVDAVDRDITALKELQSSNLDIKLNPIESTIEGFQFTANAYSLIIASNSLPFLSSKEEVKRILTESAGALTDGGILYVSLFGTKDEWNGNKEGMTFFEESEAQELISSLSLERYYQILEEGYGRTKAGGIKYWSIFKFLLKK